MNDRLTQLKQLLLEMPQDPFLMYGIGLEYVSRGDDNQALVHFHQLKQLHPDYLALYYQLGKLFERINQQQKAIEAYENGIQIAKKQMDKHTLNELQMALDELVD